jgi:hypothetical protein
MGVKKVFRATRIFKYLLYAYNFSVSIFFIISVYITYLIMSPSSYQ